MSMSGDVPVYFTSEKGGWGLAKGSVGKMMDNCKWLVENGIPITVFPEGVRSGSMEPREYKNGMFQFCKDSQVTQGFTILGERFFNSATHTL